MTDGNEIEVSKIVDEVKSRGLFDQLRQDCLRDMEIEASYRRLKSDVDRYCARFLSSQHWHPGLSKTEMRDRLRERLLRADFVNRGVRNLVERLVAFDKMHKRLYRPVERIVYSYLGLPYQNEEQSSDEETDPKEGTRAPGDDNDHSDTIRRDRDEDDLVEPHYKRQRIEENATLSGANQSTSSGMEEETPVQDEQCQPPVDPTPSSYPQFDSSGEISVGWHVTQLSPNPTAAVPGESEYMERPNDHVMTHAHEEVESPAHECL